jgi:hypothetical protein
VAFAGRAADANVKIVDALKRFVIRSAQAAVAPAR